MSAQHPDYLQKILTAQVYDVAIETPLDPAPNLSARIHNPIFLKREDMQPVFSFKLRGAYNKMAHLGPAALKRGVICASAGNHAQGVALSAKRLGARAVIVMPTTTPAIKIDAVKRHGGEVVLAGESYSDAYGHAKELEKTEKLTFVHPYDDPDVIAGQGTIAMEILRQHPKPIHAIFCCVGGGGLLAGVAAYVKRVRPDIKVIGVETADANAMTQSLAAGKRIELDTVGLFADGAAVKLVGAETFRLCQEYVDEMIVVDNDAICAAIKDVFEDTRSILEPAGALSLAGAKEYAKRHHLRDKTLVAIASGANMNFDRLRFVAERAEVGEKREAVLAVHGGAEAVVAVQLVAEADHVDALTRHNGGALRAGRNAPCTPGRGRGSARCGRSRSGRPGRPAPDRSRSAPSGRGGRRCRGARRSRRSG